MQTPTAFTARIDNNQIILAGDMDNSATVRHECETIAAAAAANHNRTQWIINAQKVRLFVGGEEIWNKIAQETLRNCHLIYLPSQLAMNLEYDDTYKHNNSRFLETDNEPIE